MTTLRERVYAWVYDFLPGLEDSSNLTDAVMYEVNNHIRKHYKQVFCWGFIFGMLFLYLILKWLA